MSFGEFPTDLAAHLDEIEDLDVLATLFQLAIRCDRLDDIRNAVLKTKTQR